MRRGPYWFQGSADAIYQNLNLLRDERPDIVLVFGADHIYRMDPQQMVEPAHRVRRLGDGRRRSAVPIEQADQFGVIETAADGRTIAAFREKPTDAVGLPDAPDQVLASMGNYVFDAEALIDALTRRRRTTNSPRTTSAATSSRCSSAAAGARSTTSRSNDVPGVTRRATAATGATSARSTPSTTRTWT